MSDHTLPELGDDTTAERAATPPPAIVPADADPSPAPAAAASFGSSDAGPAADAPASPTGSTAPTAPTGSNAPAGPAAPAGPPAKQSPRLQALKRIGGALVVFALVFAFRAFTSDDGTHGIKVGECVAAVGSDDFKKVDCTASDAVGKVTFIQTDTSTTRAASIELCSKHAADSAFVSAEVTDGQGAVICVADL
jgi:hypothetical protein